MRLDNLAPVALLLGSTFAKPIDRTSLLRTRHITPPLDRIPLRDADTTESTAIDSTSPKNQNASPPCMKTISATNDQACHEVAAPYGIQLSTFEASSKALSTDCRDVLLGYRICVDSSDKAAETSTSKMMMSSATMSANVPDMKTSALANPDTLKPSEALKSSPMPAKVTSEKTVLQSSAFEAPKPTTSVADDDNVIIEAVLSPEMTVERVTETRTFTLNREGAVRLRTAIVSKTMTHMATVFTTRTSDMKPKETATSHKTMKHSNTTMTAKSHSTGNAGNHTLIFATETRGPEDVPNRATTAQVKSAQSLPSSAGATVVKSAGSATMSESKVIHSAASAAASSVASSSSSASNAHFLQVPSHTAKPEPESFSHEMKATQASSAHVDASASESKKTDVSPTGKDMASSGSMEIKASSTHQDVASSKPTEMVTSSAAKDVATPKAKESSASPTHKDAVSSEAKESSPPTTQKDVVSSSVPHKDVSSAALHTAMSSAVATHAAPAAPHTSVAAVAAPPAAAPAPPPQPAATSPSMSFSQFDARGINAIDSTQQTTPSDSPSKNSTEVPNPDLGDSIRASLLSEAGAAATPSATQSNFTSLEASQTVMDASAMSSKSMPTTMPMSMLAASSKMANSALGTLTRPIIPASSLIAEMPHAFGHNNMTATFRGIQPTAKPVITASSMEDASSTSDITSKMASAMTSEVTSKMASERTSKMTSMKTSVKTSMASAAPMKTSSAAAADPTPATSSSDVDVYKMYTGDGSEKAGWPSMDKWVSFDHMFEANSQKMKISCKQWGVDNNSDEEIANMKSEIQSISKDTSVDPRFILAVIMQESTGCVRVITTSYSVSNPGLMQSHAGNGTCNTNSAAVTGSKVAAANTLLNPCPKSEIRQMIADGTNGTASGDGLKQVLSKAGGTDVSRFYKAARMYNGGSIDPSGDLGKGCCTLCYASDIANRLTGWVMAEQKCNMMAKDKAISHKHW